MKRRWATLLALVLVAALAGCTGGGVTGGQNDPGDTQPPAPEPEPQQVTLPLIAGELDSLDPHRAASSAAHLILRNAMEGLVRPGPDGVPAKGSGQAADWTVSADGLTYTFTLKQGLTWSDGRPVTAADFAYGWTRALDPGAGSAQAYLLYIIQGARAFNELKPEAPDFAQRYEQLKGELGIAAPDARTLTVTLERPAPELVSLLAAPAFLPVRQDLAEAQGPAFGDPAGALVSNGPFQWDGAGLRKNPAYWDAGEVKLEQVAFQPMADVNEALRLFAEGKLDLAQVPGELQGQYQELVNQPGGATFYVEINTRHPVLDSRAVRQALAAALDRERFVREAARAGGQPAAGLLPPGLAAAAASGTGPWPAFDPEAAQAALAQALAELKREALPSLKLLVEDNPTALRYAQALQAIWQSHLGITVEPEPVPAQRRLDRARSGDFDLLLTGWIADHPDPGAFMELWATGGPFNYARWSSGPFDQLLAQARQTADPGQRAQLLRQAEELLAAELPLVPLYHPVRHWARQPWLHGVAFLPVGGELDLKSAYVVGKAGG